MDDSRWSLNQFVALGGIWGIHAVTVARLQTNWSAEE